MELSSTAIAISIIGLAAAYLSVPLLISVLHRIRAAAAQIERYAQTTQRASEGIADNLEPVPALQRTGELLGAAHGLADELAAGAERAGAELLRRAGETS